MSNQIPHEKIRLNVSRETSQQKTKEKYRITSKLKHLGYIKYKLQKNTLHLDLRETK